MKPLSKPLFVASWCFFLLLGSSFFQGSAAADTSSSATGDITIVVDDPGGVAARVSAPISVEVDRSRWPERLAAASALKLIEIPPAPDATVQEIAVQFIAEAPAATEGRLWWLMPSGYEGRRRFRLAAASQPSKPIVQAQPDKMRGAVDVVEGDKPVLRYNQATVPPPPEIVEAFETNRNPPLDYARGDYIHPLYGPSGESLTDDYSLNHPHHRGISWAWPVVRYRGEARDLWAVRVLPSQPGGIWARPVSLDRLVSGPVAAAIEATNHWKWGDRKPIVREQVVIRAFRETNARRFVDVDLRLTALVDEVSIGGRPGGTYGGFALRSFPEFDRRQIRMHLDPPGAEPRRAWFHLSGAFPGGEGLAGVALMEHPGNPDYPSRPKPTNADRVPGKYPKWRTVQPAWPGDREVKLPKGEPLLLKYRVWIHPGAGDEATLAAVSSAYAESPHVRQERRNTRGGK